jgi:LmbE family N-acetylglucosaminyl deacetylase
MSVPQYLDPPPMPQALTAPPARGRVLVVAPHPDDELIGAGGTVLQHRQLGDPINIVILTDGAHGDAGGSADPQQRAAESRVAAERLGAKGIQFLGFPDGARARREDLGAVVPRLLECFEQVQPEVIYCPHQGEVHTDHFVTAVAVRQALHVWGRPVACFGYEIWTALAARWVVDISAQMEEKLAIARLYQTQVEHTDLLHFFGGLNAYRAVFLPKGARYGEAFCRLAPQDPGR